MRISSSCPLVCWGVLVATMGSLAGRAEQSAPRSVMAVDPAAANVIAFPPQRVSAIRLVIHRSNRGQPCLDELEVYGPDSSENLALRKRGGRASASSSLTGYAIHRVEHLNDGLYGNDHSWICGSNSGWAQIDLPREMRVDRVVFSRDRKGRYRDRVPVVFELQVSANGASWRTVRYVVSADRVPPDKQLENESVREWALRLVASLPQPWQAQVRKQAETVKTEKELRPLLELLQLQRQRQVMQLRLPLLFNPQAIQRAVADLQQSYPDRFQLPSDFSQKLEQFRQQRAAVLSDLKSDDLEAVRRGVAAGEAMIQWSRSILLSNPAIDFDELLILKRQSPQTEQDHPYWRWGQRYGLTVNWSCDFRPKNPPVAPWWNDSLVAVKIRAPDTPARTVFAAEPGKMIQHPELHYDADRLLFSMPGPQDAFQVFELELNSGKLRQVTTDTGPEVDNGDPCYLPDGRIIFNSTRLFIGVPCEDGRSYVSNLCLTDAAGTKTRILTFDQESNWYPTVLNDGRVLYTRYEYANISHQFGRLLFRMNPDGTGQVAYYGTNSYWPNSIFYARPIPDHPTMVIGVVCGHHGPNKTGRLVLFDPARGDRETAGAVQTIPGYGKPVERVVADHLYEEDWPKFVHPWPINGRYFLVSARLHPQQQEYAIYLVDIYDNITEIARAPGYSLFEPIPLRKRNRPPSLPDRVDLKDKQATIYLADVYRGEPMRGVPRGTVRRLRLFTYNYLYRDTLSRGFGHLATPGVDGPWEPRFLLGTVPVEEDGSALFQVPANTPISVQPLDEKGRAVQLMRSWYTAMPGERFTCVGCHESSNQSPPPGSRMALARPPSEITPWQGPARGFDFEVEIQPLLDRYCTECHDGSDSSIPDLSRKDRDEQLRINREYQKTTSSSISTIFTPAYIALHPYVRRPHAESNGGPQVAGEFSADTSLLVQLLEKGHYGVTLDAESWERLYTWIDLGAPDHGSWKNSEWGVPADYARARKEILARDANRLDDVEWIPRTAKVEQPSHATAAPSNRSRSRTTPRSQATRPHDWPLDEKKARERQAAIAKKLGIPVNIRLQLSSGVDVPLVLIPPGEFLMGTTDGAADERPRHVVSINRPFYLSCREISNREFAAVMGDTHFSGYAQWRSIDQRGQGYSLHDPRQPVVRVSWNRAMEFCRRLSATTGRAVTLPTEAEWEWACRAGSDTDHWYGTADDDFSRKENLAGREQHRFAFQGKPVWYLRDDRYDDGQLVSAPAGSYQANPWGLYDMAGNVSEWTRTSYRDYPYRPDDGRNDVDSPDDKVVRGGSWYVPPRFGRSSWRWKYPPWRRVFNVGFRIAVAVD